MSYHQRLLGASIGLLLLVACSAAAPPRGGSQPGATIAVPTVTSSNVQSVPTVPPTMAATEAPPTPAIATEAQIASAEREFITPEGYHGLGNLDAPATIVMYSDVF
jgi:protein-disulfide isomerase